MGDIVKRGTRSAPKFYIRFRDVDGTRRMKLAEGADTKEKATKALRAAEWRVTQGLVGIAERTKSASMGPLLERWIGTLTNRSANSDRARYKLHLAPWWNEVTVAEGQNVGQVLKWIEAMRKVGELSEQSMRHNVALLSRFWQWAILEEATARGSTGATVNPCKMVPSSHRPQQAPKDTTTPWISDDAVVIALMGALPEPLNLMFYIGNRAGLRTGEIAGLRMSDMEHLREGAIRVRFSYDGPLKEDKKREGKVKWAPAPEDAEEFLGMWLKRRKLEGAKGEDLVFPAPPELPRRPRKVDAWIGYRREHIGECWDRARDKVNEDAAEARATEPRIDAAMTWYQATRHSFASRNLSAKASRDEVSSALGHSSPTVTAKHYDHAIVKTFSSVLRRRLGASSGG